MRWDKDYKNPEVINDPTVIPAYGVTDEERARWNAKQDALEYDAVPTPFSDKHLISGAIYNALEQYRASTTQACQDYYWSIADGLAETRQIVISAAESANDSKIAAGISETNAASSASNAFTSARNAAESELNASNSANNSSYSAQYSESCSRDSEAYAVGTRNGSPVTEGDPAYHHNSKYFADLGREVINDEVTSEYFTWSSDKLSTLLSGKADLENGKIPASQLPSYVDDVKEYSSLSDFPATGESDKIYIAIDTNKEYRWTGSTYAIISESLALGETSSTAYAGNKGKQNADNILALQGLVTGIQDVIPSTATSSNKLVSTSEMGTALQGKSDTSHTHDDRYYTEAEVDSALSGKAAASHTHDDRYYTETEIDNKFNGVTFTTSNNEIYINW